ncbi:Uroporphyrinogen decarboxylase [Hibiscus syriacus]|uniref:uroporphyrinogen decarboxylase n=1 Tax=Hibiscus syriacus TaxID=106335 RepID=A0A6A2YWG3_HIBSY|nr:Uroporphyrinogen decarboxylase [Hibiscus syriacus]
MLSTYARSPFIWFLDPLLVKAARGDPVSRPPAWMMRQAGRYMAVYRKLAEKHPSFRERSETTNLIVEISLQPWEAFRSDGVIIFSDMLTPLPAFGVPFDIEEVRGPVIQSPIHSEYCLKALHPIELEKLHFVGESLKIFARKLFSILIVGDHAAVLGFVGAPWTIATYIVEGGTTRTYTIIKSMCHTAPNLLRALLSHLTKAIAEYIIYQVEPGAHCMQIFDSWGGQLPPDMREKWSKIYITGVVKRAGPRGHILNLGHGVLVGTPEEAVAHFFYPRSFVFLLRIGDEGLSTCFHNKTMLKVEMHPFIF